MKLPIIGILSGVALATLGISGIAEAFQLIPSGLSPGNQYRLVFFTDGTIHATSTDINTYNTFVDNEAHTSTILNDAFTNVGIDPASITWKVIGSTASVNAIDNTST
ncbi:MAG: PEP-CTERM sorting domain-containing protein, partial [Microcystis sp.]